MFLYTRVMLKSSSVFRKRDFKEKKKILEGILECDFTNETIIKYLDENWSNLIREVGLSLV